MSTRVISIKDLVESDRDHWLEILEELTPNKRRKKGITIGPVIDRRTNLNQGRSLLLDENILYADTDGIIVVNPTDRELIKNAFQEKAIEHLGNLLLHHDEEDEEG